MSVYLCPLGLCCLSTIAAGITLWLQAFPKWPATAAFAKIIIGVAGAILFFVVPATVSAQDMTRDEAKAEADDLAAGLEGEVRASATQTVDAESVPSFVTDDPAETDHYSNPEGLESVGLSSLLTHEEGQVVSTAIVSRPLVTPEELATWTANGLTIEGDATSIVSEYSGTYGDCTVTVSGGAGGARYRYSCNSGDTLLSFEDRCRIPLEITVPMRHEFECLWIFLDSDLSWEPEPFCFALGSEPSCGPLTFHGGGDCLPDWKTGVDLCTPRRFRTTCDISLIDGRSPVRTVPGTPIEAWNSAACDANAADPNCTLLSEMCVEGPETRTIGGVDVTRDCWAYERTYACSSLGGEVTDCDVPAGCILEGSTCLSTDDLTGECRATEHQYVCETAGAPGGAVGYCEEDVYCIDGDCETLTRPQNDEFPEAVSALAMMGQLQDDVDDATLTIFPGEYHKCDKAIAGLQNCCRDDGFLTDIGFDCSADDRALANKQSAGLCHYVGTYCSDRTLFGICLKKRKTFCCFNNVLARLIHEQGRPQVGWDWGSTKTPDCSGYTVALFQALDLSLMDFSEFYDGVLDTFVGPDTDAAAAAITTRIIDAYACPPNC